MVTFGGDYMDLPSRFQGSSPESAKENVAALAREIAETLAVEIVPAAE